MWKKPNRIAMTGTPFYAPLLTQTVHDVAFLDRRTPGERHLPPLPGHSPQGDSVTVQVAELSEHTIHRLFSGCADCEKLSEDLGPAVIIDLHTDFETVFLETSRE
jgi:hypothetical protein